MALGILLGVLTLLVGASAFGWFLYRFIMSYSVETGVWGTDVTSNGDYMVAMLLGFFVAFVGIYHIYRVAKRKRALHLWFLELSIGALVSLVYAAARLIKCNQKGVDGTLYWIWGGVSLGIFVIFLIIYIVRLNLIKKAEAEKALEEKKAEEEKAAEEKPADQPEAEEKKEDQPEQKPEEEFEPKVIEINREEYKYRVRNKKTNAVIARFKTKAEADAYVKSLRK